MVRRWSCINEISNFENNFFSLFKKNKLNIFKKSVKLKRFNKKYSKMRRKSFSRIKHKRNWYLYNNVFKFWTQDYQKNKYLIKYQCLEGIFLTNFFFFHQNFFFKKKNSFFFFDFYFNTFSKKLMNFFFFQNTYNNNKHSKISYFYFCYSNITRAWSKNNLFETSKLIKNNNFPSSYSEWDNQLFVFNQISDIDTFNKLKILDNFLFNFNFLIQKLKIIYMIFLYNSYKNINVNFFCF